MKLKTLETLTKRIVTNINTTFEQHNEQRESLTNGRNLIEKLYAFTLECMNDEQAAIDNLDGYSKSRKGDNPYHAPVKFILDGTEFFPCDLTHFATIFFDAAERGIAAKEIYGVLKSEYGNKRAWYEAVNGAVRAKHTGKDATTKRKLKALAKVHPFVAKDVDLKCGNAADILDQVPDGSVDSVVTDPPYGTDITRKIGNDWDSPKGALDTWKTVFPEAFKKLKPGGYLVAFCDRKTVHRMVTVLDDTGFIIKDILIRENTYGFPADPFGLRNVTEHIVVARKGNKRENDPLSTFIRDYRKANDNRYPTNYLTGYGRVEQWERNLGFDCITENKRDLGKRYMDGNHPSTVRLRRCGTYYWEAKSQKWIGDGQMPESNEHPCLKPMNLLAYLIGMVTPKNGVVLDPFMGAGSTGLGCVLSGRRFLGIEIEPNFKMVAEQRIKALQEFSDSKLKRKAA